MKKMSRTDRFGKRSYWVVSPNVRNNEATVPDWKQASLVGHAAFMGWKPDDRGHKGIGFRFAHVIKSGDIILIARRHKHRPDIVGFGVVNGNYKTRLRSIKTPQSFGSLRRLSPFIPWSAIPPGIPFLSAVRHTAALARLHPRSNEAHQQLCKWLDLELAKQNPSNGASENSSNEQEQSRDAILADPRKNDQFDYEYRAKSEIKKARKREAELMQGYRLWLKQRQREIQIAKYGKLECDGFEKARNNLIEAKSSAKREYIRMAVGQLLDYAFQGSKKFGSPHMAILVPEKPRSDIEKWLTDLKISLIWLEKGIFQDNADGKFI
jgi:hypothetical protein